MELANCTFIDIKEAYIEKRKNELKKISGFLKKDRELVTNVAVRKGSNKYKSGSRFEREYDLRNWMWLDAEINNVNFLISLQAFDRDPKTGNMHVLMDRLGIYAYVGKYSHKEAQTKMLITEIELPMDNEKLEKLKNILGALSNCDIFKMQYQLEECVKEKRLV